MLRMNKSLVIVLAASASLLVSGCNAWEGLQEDAGDAGDAIQDTVDDDDE
jgi:predicted small secreted protein